MSSYIKVFWVALAMLLTVGTVEAGTVTTDADAFVYLGGSGNYGEQNTIVLKRSSSGTTSTYNRSGWVHFDLAGQPSATEAVLTFTFHADSSIASSGTVAVWGIIDGQPGDELGTDWSETEITRDNALYNMDFAEGENLTQLGSFSWTSAPTDGDEFTVSTEALADFINADTNDEITILLSRNINDGNFSLRSRESGSPATLDIEYLPRAWQPNPVDKQDGVSVDSPLVLTWNTGLDPDDQLQIHPDITHHQLYITGAILDGSDPNFAAVSPIEIPVSGANSSHTINTLLRDATYGWRVDEKMADNSVVTGLVWTFDTALSVPTIEVDLVADTLVDAGTEVNLSIEALNPFTGDGSGITYMWYQNDELVQSSASDTFTIAAADIANEGKYSCTVKINSNGAMVNSADGWVNVKRVIQYHAFNADLTDGIGTNDGAAYEYVTYPTGDPNIFDATAAFGPGWDGSENSAIAMDGSYYVNIGSFGHPHSNVSLEHGSAACWIKTTATDVNIMGAYESQPQYYTTGFQFHIKGGALRGYLRDMDATSVERNTGIVNDDQWHYVVATWNGTPTGGDMALYVDGVSQGKTTVTGEFQPFGQWQLDMLIGASNGRGVPSGFFVGLMDELEVYNYSFNDEDVASLYFEYTGEKTCLFPPTMDRTGPLGTADCVVDLYDFASFAASWMESGLRPE
ncbi:MAG: hypothetical protein JEZ07_17135 [Phycisphaerae bacterium]|nr:hypothetical protein [Phycisphaerae bacterium]